MLEFFSEAGQSTTAFGIDKPNLIVTSIAIDLDGNVWTGHMKVWDVWDMDLTTYIQCDTSPRVPPPPSPPNLFKFK